MNQRKEEDVLVLNERRDTSGAKIAALIVFVWMLLGVLAFITSLVCFAYDGSFMQNWVGFLTALILGPFYWIYYAYVGGSYCKSGGNRQQLIRQIKQFSKKRFAKKGKKKA